MKKEGENGDENMPSGAQSYHQAFVPTLSSATRAGKVELFGGLCSYISGPDDSQVAVVLILDVYGYEAPNLRKLADKVASAGFFTVVPDFFKGDPYGPDKISSIFEWLKDHGVDQGFEDAKPVIEALKGKRDSQDRSYKLLLGAKVVTELAKEASINAAVLLVFSEQKGKVEIKAHRARIESTQTGLAQDLRHEKAEKVGDRTRANREASKDRKTVDRKQTKDENN